MSSNWSNLSSVDKQAFYSILDEYFSSRPHLFTSPTSHPPQTTQGALTHLAIAHPTTTSSALKAAGVPPSLAKPSNVSTVAAASNHLNGLSGRVSQFAGQWNNKSSDSTPPTPTPPTPHVASNKPSSPVVGRDNFIGGIVSQTDRDRAHPKPRSTTPSTSFAPPPIRRTPAPPPPPPQPQPKPDLGQFVEAMFDYDGTSPEDLSFKEHQVIKVTEKISDDWWNGQIDGGPIGMFPASYVKPI